MESIRGVNVSNSALEVIATVGTTTTPSYAVSISTGTVKATPGVLYGFWGSTAGTMAIKDGSNQLGVVTISANVIQSLPSPIYCTTSISISASSAVATVLYL